MMKTLNKIDQLSEIKGATHLAMGVFDGVHLGHQSVIQQVLDRAKSTGGKAGVLTFQPHPIQVLAPQRAPARLLTPIDDKIAILEQLGLDFLCIVNFDHSFAQIRAKAFIQQLCASSENLKTIAVGENWAFGNGREGNTDKLKEWSQHFEFALCATPSVMFADERISSTRIRKALEKGDIQSANGMLGRNYKIKGAVIKGKGLARQLGFRTANLRVNHELPVADGVWQLKVHHHSNTYEAIANLGYRPTIEEEKTERLLEIHLLDFDQDIYGETLHAEFIDYLRKEERFPSVEALKAAIQRDIITVRSK